MTPDDATPPAETDGAPEVEAPDDQHEVPKAAMPLRRRVGRVAAWGMVAVLWTAGAGAIGFWQGWQQADARVSVPAPVVELAVAQPTSDATVPDEPELVARDVVGLTVERAVEVLLDAGVVQDAIETTDVQQVGDLGVVVAQDPPGGARVDGQVTLQVSTPATVPDVVGQPEADARRTLGDLGAAVQRVAVVDGSSEVGTVVAVDPAPGEALDGPLRLQVAVGPDGVLTTQLRSDDGSGCSIRQEVVAARTTYDEAVRCDLSRPGDQGNTVYLLADGVLELTTTVALADNSDARGQARFQLRTEDGVADEAVVALGESADLTADLTDAVRVELAVVTLEPDDADWDTIDAVFGRPRLVGTPEAIDEVVERSGQ